MHPPRPTAFRVLPALVLSTLTGLALVPASRAADSDTDSTAPAKLDKIEVTGSNIRRTDTETPAPVQIITADDIKKSGYTSVGEVLRNISANNQGSISNSNPNGFSGGASGVALRGLTVGATLVLIDGHRVAPYPLSDDGERTFVDVTAIPFDAIDHIEVLKDGASAIYGSDAIAGVINVILKKHFEGTRMSADAGLSKHGDGGTQRFSVLTGMKFTDSTDGFFNFEYRHQSPIYTANRPGIVLQRDFTSIGGVNLTPGVPNVLNNGTPGSLTGYTQNPNTGAITSLPGCSPSSANYAGTSSNGGSFCSYYPNSFEVAPDTQNVNLIGRLNTTLSDTWEAVTTLSMFQSDGEKFNNFNSTGGATGINNPVVAYGVAPSVYPASNYVTHVSTGDVLFYNFPTLGQQHGRIDTENYRVAEDLKGEALGWDLSAAVGYTKAINHYKLSNALSVFGLQQLVAANSTVSPAQLVQILGNPANTPILAPTSQSTSINELDYISLNGSREVATLPGGPLSAAVGVETSYHAQSEVSPGLVAEGYAGGFDPWAHGSQTISAAHFELDGKVLKDLEINVAGRIDEVNTYGNSATPKFGFEYTPAHEVLFRGTYARGFRAPNIAERAGSSAFGLGQSVDPALCPGGAANNGTPQIGDFQGQCNVSLTFVQGANPNLEPEKSRSYTLGVVFEPITGFSASADYYDILLKNQIQTASEQATFNPFAPGTLIRGPAGQLIPTVVAINNGVPVYGAAQPTPVGVIQYINSPYINLTSTEVAGIDLDFRGRFKLPEIGTVVSDMQVSHIYRYLLTNGSSIYELAGTHGPSGISGDTGTPQTRIQWTTSLERPDWSVAATVNYISSFGVNDPSTANYATCTQTLETIGQNVPVFYGNANYPQGYCKVGSFTTLDLYGNFIVDKHWAVHGSIVNALDRSAPLDFATYGSSGAYNPAYHESGVIGRYFSIGAVYDF